MTGQRKILLGATAAIALVGGGSSVAFAAEQPAAEAGQPLPATADQSDGSSYHTNEIIVTAQKRSERLTDVPISITAATAEQLDRAGIDEPSDLGRIVPGFSYQLSATGSPIYAIRGIGFYDDSQAAPPTVSIYVDQAPLPFSAMAQGAGLDIERVEVLKGPQGTLFGQNSTAGAINYIAARPTADTHMGFDVTFARFGNVDARGFVTGGLADGLRIRVAGRREYSGPSQTSESRPDDRLGKKDFVQGRVLVDWDATSTLSFKLDVNGWIDRSEVLAYQFIGTHKINPAGPSDVVDALAGRLPTPNNPRLADWDTGQDYQRNTRQYQFALRGDWDLSDAVTLTSISSYVKFKSFMPFDPDGTDVPNFFDRRTARLQNFSQEIRVAADLSDVKVTAGANYQRDKTFGFDTAQLTSSVTTIGPLRYTSFSQLLIEQVSTYSAFGNVEAPITSSLTVVGGARYTKQDRDGQGCLLDGGDGTLAAAVAQIPTGFGLPYAPAPNGSCVSLNPDGTLSGLIRRSLNEDNLSWRGGLNWKPTSDTLVYASVTKGYKSGSFPIIPAVFTPTFSAATQESVLSYELGAKGSFFDRRVDLAAAVYAYQYKDKQLLGTKEVAGFVALPSLINVPRSRAVGVEASIGARPVRGLSLNAAVNYLDTRVSRSFLSQDPFGNPLDLKGEPFPNAPKWHFIGDATYEFPVTSSVQAYLSGNVSYRTKTNATFAKLSEYVIPGYAIAGLSFGVEDTDKRWKVEVFGRNIFDKLYVTNIFTVNDIIERQVGSGATYGVTLGTRF